METKVNLSKNLSKAISVCFILLLSLGMCLTVKAASVPSDVLNHWANGYAQDWVDKGIDITYQDGSFKPDQSITRGEFVTFVNDYFGFNSSATNNFTDIGSSDIISGQVGAAVKQGYISGYPDGTFKPNNTITREEIAVVVTRLISAEQDTEYANVFTDRGKIDWSKGYVGAAVKNNVLAGYPEDGSFRPKSNMTRAEALVTIANSLSSKNSLASNTTTSQSNNTANNTTSNTNNNTTNTSNKVSVNNSSYGPSSGTETISGSMEINYDGASVKNVIVKKDLTISSDVKNGEVRLDNVEVSGTMYVYGGGESTVTLNNCNISNLVVDKGDDKVRVLVKGKTDVKNTEVLSGAILEEGTLNSSYEGFRNVKLTKSTKSSVTVNITGSVDTLDIYSYKPKVNFKKGTIKNLNFQNGASSPTVNLSSGTTVTNAEFDCSGKVQGSGKISKATVNVSGVILEKKPTNLYGDKNPTYESSGEYNVEFTVVDSSNTDTKIKDAYVSFDGGYQYTDSNGRTEFEGISNDTYTVKVTKSGYKDYSSSVSVSNDTTRTIKLVKGSGSSTDTYTANITVKDSSGTLSGATVSLGGSDVSTSSSGLATFYDLSEKSYTVTIQKSGYTTQTATITISGSDVSKTYTLVKSTSTGTATVTVKSNSVVSGATVTINGTTATTNASGIATISSLPYGTYKITVKKDGYTHATDDSITINSASKSTTVYIDQNAVTYTITVKLEDKQSQPVMGAKVTIGTKSGISDDQGSVTISGISAGQYDVAITHKDYLDKIVKGVMISDNETLNVTGLTAVTGNETIPDPDSP